MAGLLPIGPGGLLGKLASPGTLLPGHMAAPGVPQAAGHGWHASPLAAKAFAAAFLAFGAFLWLRLWEGQELPSWPSGPRC